MLKSNRAKPIFFEAIYEEAKKQWDLREEYPEYGSNTWQLFQQIQKPDHVISELLQNADDANASEVIIRLQDDLFIIEHDGRDFTEEEFGALCKFGMSSKRNLYTIGFRGIGFKSTFSIGNSVKVLTPSIAVRFERNRFTMPYWMDHASPTEKTLIRVEIQDPARKQNLISNLNQWADHPVSLLFFKKIKRLIIQTDSDINRFIRKTQISKSPISNSSRFALEPCDDSGTPLNKSEKPEYLLIRLPDIEFPDFAKEEIKEERFSTSSEIPSFNIDLVLGLQGEQKIYVVLPTEVNLWLPFSINAPFIPDPDRVSIRSPSISKTNEWILEEVGKFAGKCLLNLLNDKTLNIKKRIKAYDLFPKNIGKSNTLGEKCSSIVCNKMQEEIVENPVLLAFDGTVVGKDQCIALPKELYSVWSEETLNKIFGTEDEKLLSKEVSEDARQKLESWHMLRSLDQDTVIEKMTSIPVVPQPTSFESIQNLWKYINTSIRSSYDERWKSVKMVPVEGKNEMYASQNVIRLSEKSVLDIGSLEFVKKHTNVFDREFIQWVNDTEKGNEENKSNNRDVLNAALNKLGLDQASPSNILIKNINVALSKNNVTQKSDYIRLAQIAAALNVKVEKDFQYITKGNKLKKVDNGIIFSNAADFESIIPKSFTERHFIESTYTYSHIACSESQWSKWSSSNKSGLLPFVPFEKRDIRYSSLGEVNKLALKRNFEALSEDELRYTYKTHFKLSDYDFPYELIESWNTQSKNDQSLWADILTKILRSPSWYWEKSEYSTLKEVSNNGRESKIERKIPAGWIIRFRSLRCLIDTNGNPNYPSSLFMRTPENEPLMNTPDFNFVDASLDNEQTKPLLQILGVMDSLSNISPLIERLQHFSTQKEPLKILHEIVPVYKAIDNITKKSQTVDQASVLQEFYEKKLVLTQEGHWSKAGEGEVFLSNDDNNFEVATVHDSISNLPIWKLLGIEEKPSNDIIINWLKKLVTGGKFDGQLVKQIKAALKRYPVIVWEECQHWLTLSDHWMPIDKLKYHLRNNEIKHDKLYDSIRSVSADFRMVPAETCDDSPFNVLKDLNKLISYKPKFTDRKRNAESKEWIKALGNGLKRIKKEDDDETSRIRTNGERLSETTWQSVGLIESQPYIGNEIVGESIRLNVLWDKDKLFVPDNYLKFIKKIASELSKPFEDKDIKAAVEFCFNRDEKEIIEYLEANFDLEPEESISRKEQKEDGKKDKNKQDGKPNNEGRTNNKGTDSGQNTKKELSLKNVEKDQYIVGRKKERIFPQGSGGGGGEGGGNQTEPTSSEDKKKIEICSRQYVIEHLRKLGYENIQEMDFYHQGYDIEAEEDGNQLLVEVKGHAGSALKADVSVSQIREHDKHLNNKSVVWELWNVENMSADVSSPVTITRISHIPDEAMEAKAFRVDLTKCSVFEKKEDEHRGKL